MIKIFSIDPGIVNLGLCLMDECYNIIYWDSINLNNDSLSNKKITCEGINKNKKQCKRKAIYTKDDNFFCNKHKQDNDEYKLINPEKKKITDYSYQDLCKSTIKKLKEVFEINKDNFNDVEYIIIENQFKSTDKIHFISNVIFTWLTEYYTDSNTKIMFIHGKYKLMVEYNGPEIECNLKSKYSRNKFFSVKYTEYFIKDNENDINHFNSFIKKDENADTYLLNRYFISNGFKIKKKIKIKTKTKTSKKINKLSKIDESEKIAVI